MHSPSEFHIVLHGLAETLVFLVGEHYVADFCVWFVQDPLVVQRDALKVAHCTLCCGVAADDVLFLKVDNYGSSWDNIGSQN